MIDHVFSPLNLPIAKAVRLVIVMKKKFTLPLKLPTACSLVAFGVLLTIALQCSDFLPLARFFPFVLSRACSV